MFPSFKRRFSPKDLMALSNKRKCDIEKTGKYAITLLKVDATL